jgi:hypothetical protein
MKRDAVAVPGEGGHEIGGASKYTEKIVATDAPCDKRFISVITIEKPKDRELTRLHGLSGRLDGAQ